MSKLVSVKIYIDNEVMEDIEFTRFIWDYEFSRTDFNTFMEVYDSAFNSATCNTFKDRIRYELSDRMVLDSDLWKDVSLKFSEKLVEEITKHMLTHFGLTDMIVTHPEDWIYTYTYTPVVAGICRAYANAIFLLTRVNSIDIFNLHEFFNTDVAKKYCSFFCKLVNIEAVKFIDIEYLSNICKIQINS